MSLVSYNLLTKNKFSAKTIARMWIGVSTKKYNYTKKKSWKV